MKDSKNIAKMHEKGEGGMILYSYARTTAGDAEERLWVVIGNKLIVKNNMTF